MQILKYWLHRDFENRSLRKQECSLSSKNEGRYLFAEFLQAWIRHVLIAIFFLLLLILITWLCVTLKLNQCYTLICAEKNCINKHLNSQGHSTCTKKASHNIAYIYLPFWSHFFQVMWLEKYNLTVSRYYIQMNGKFASDKTLKYKYLQ